MISTVYFYIGFLSLHLYVGISLQCLLNKELQGKDNNNSWTVSCLILGSSVDLSMSAELENTPLNRLE